uniref:Protein phosphatase 1 regulatory subunit 21 n=1 Tax=Eptatretus burgeri TaxID=7764 RepID=A0A8C4QDA3_EPTBU
MAGDLQARYQKLAQEYSKLRAQNQVLKKAVLDEKEAAVGVKEQLKGKEQTVRRIEQEMESLTFRNQQLTKRVELLQTELETVETSARKGKAKVAEVTALDLTDQRCVFDEDLKKKIEENERLHKQVFEGEELRLRVESELRSKLSEIEAVAAGHNGMVEAMRLRQQENVERLQQDKARLEARVQALEKEAIEQRLRADEWQQELGSLRTQLISQLAESDCLIQEKIAFNDTCFPEYNSLNVPAHDRNHQHKAREVTERAHDLVKDLVAALLNFHTYTEQRSLIYPVDSSMDVISAVNQRFCHHLHENASHVRPIERSLWQLLESITEDSMTTLETATLLKVFSDSFATYVSYLAKLLPYQLKSLDEECMSPLCTTALRARNRDLQKDLAALTTAFQKVHCYISLLALPNTSPAELHPDNHSVVFTKLAEALHSLHQAVEELSRHYALKVSLEHELPTASQKLRTTDECVISSILALTNVTKKVATFFTSNMDFFSRPETSWAGGRQGRAKCFVPEECTLRYRKHAANYIRSLQKLQQSQQTVIRLEQEKEHWQLECQLIQARLSRELQEHLRNLRSDSRIGVPDGAPMELCLEGGEREGDRDKTQDAARMVGKFPNIETNGTGSEKESREQLIKKYYAKRIAELTLQLQLADSKAVHFHAECRALSKRLALTDKNQQALHKELALSKDCLSQLQDEFTTTRRSYEDQLSTMSDHLCGVNDTLAKQREEIDALKQCSKVSSRKSRNR